MAELGYLAQYTCVSVLCVSTRSLLPLHCLYVPFVVFTVLQLVLPLSPEDVVAPVFAPRTVLVTFPPTGLALQPRSPIAVR